MWINCYQPAADNLTLNLFIIIWNVCIRDLQHFLQLEIYTLYPQFLYCISVIFVCQGFKAPPSKRRGNLKFLFRINNRLGQPSAASIIGYPP